MFRESLPGDETPGLPLRAPTTLFVLYIVPAMGPGPFVDLNITLSFSSGLLGPWPMLGSAPGDNTSDARPALAFRFRIPDLSTE